MIDFNKFFYKFTNKKLYIYFFKIKIKIKIKIDRPESSNR